MVTQVRIVDDADYNRIRTKLANIMGSGAGTFGYGQTVVSSTVVEGQTITKEQWDKLRFDILNARIHQDGITPTVVEAVRGQPIRYAESSPAKQYDTQADTSSTNRFQIGSGQFVIESADSQSRLTGWKTKVTSIVTVSFPTADSARWFFNSGGKIRFSSSRVGGSSSPQNSAWSSLLANIGTVSFGAGTPGVNFYLLSSTYQTFFSGTQSAPYQYAANAYVIRVRSDVGNNSNGGARVLTFEVSWEDNYFYSYRGGSALVPDNVDGILTLTVDELRASGTLLPIGTGAFTVTRPSYSITAISGS